MADLRRRRQLHFNTIDEVVAEAEQLAGGEVETTGSYSCGQIFEHLARTLDVVSGYMTASHVPFPMRVTARLIRPFILRRPMGPGFNV